MAVRCVTLEVRLVRTQVLPLFSAVLAVFTNLRRIVVYDLLVWFEFGTGEVIMCWSWCVG